MSEYNWICSDCGKTTGECTTGSYDFGDEIECPWCGRVSRITNIEHNLFVEMTKEKISPTKLEELELLKSKVVEE